jgi:hypothetical protein
MEPSFADIFREWGRIGCIGFGGPPAHIALFRELCVLRRAVLPTLLLVGCTGVVAALLGAPIPH